MILIYHPDAEKELIVLLSNITAGTQAIGDIESMNHEPSLVCLRTSAPSLPHSNSVYFSPPA